MERQLFGLCTGETTKITYEQNKHETTILIYKPVTSKHPKPFHNIAIFQDR